MLGSLYSAISGLRAHQTKMNVIGNNIANVNTYGFKASRVTFSDVFYQTLSASTASDTETGGTNPAQLGYGTSVASIDVLNTQAGSATTDRALDVYINGEGYLAVKASDGQVSFTRVGNLSFDSSGNLVDSNGNMVLGLTLDATAGMAQLGADGTTDTSNLMAIQIDPEELDEYSDISIDETGAILGIKEGDPTVTKGTGTGWMTTAAIDADSLYSGEMRLDVVRSSTVQMIEDTGITGITMDNDADINGDVTITEGTTSGGNTTYTLSYSKIGETTTTTVDVTVATGTTPLTFAVDDIAGTGTANFTVALDATGVAGVDMPAVAGTALTIGTVTASTMDLTITTYNKAGEEVTLTVDDYTPTTTSDTINVGDFTFTVDGTALGVLEDQTNTMIGSVGAGDSTTVTIGSIAICKFLNADGLIAAGSGYFLESSNSGEAIATIPGDSGTGSLVSGALEMSNVDLSQQFTEMITAQRGFQANARVITTSDTMLEELVNLKR